MKGLVKTQICFYRKSSNSSSVIEGLLTMSGSATVPLPASPARSSFLLQVAVPVLLILFAVLYQINNVIEGHDQQISRIRSVAQNLGTSLATGIAGTFQSVDITLQAGADRLHDLPTAKAVHGTRFSLALDALQRRVPVLMSLKAADQRGDLLFDASAPDSRPDNIAASSYFRTLQAHPEFGMLISDPIKLLEENKWIVICARRFNLSDGQFGGIVFGAIELEGLADKLIGKDLTFSANDSFLLRNERSVILIRRSNSHTDTELTGKKISSPHIIAFDQSGTKSITYLAHSVLDQTERMFYMQLVEPHALGLIVGLSIEDAMAGWRAETQKKLVSTLIFILVVLVGFALIHRQQHKKITLIDDLETTSSKLNQLIDFNEAIIQNSPIPIAVYTRDGQCVKVNDILTELLDVSQSRFMAENFYQNQLWKHSKLPAVSLDVLTQDTRGECEIRVNTTGAREIILDAHIFSLQQAQEQLLLVQLVDQTEIRSLNSTLENILKSMNEGVHVIDQHGCIVLENAAAIGMLGWTLADHTQVHNHEAFHHHSDYPQRSCPMMATLRDGQTRTVEDERFWHKNGHSFPVEYTVTAIPNPNGTGRSVTVVFRDITCRRQLEEELRRQATHDVLTGLPNRRLLIDRLTQAIHNNRRQNGHAALLFLDLNRFKLLNDTHGHEIGDQLLIEVGNRLKTIVRETDTVARIGGDEFVVLLVGLDADADLASKYTELVAEKISRRLGQDYTLGAIVHRSSASIGIEVFIAPEDPEQVLRAADAAMYASKKSRDHSSGTGEGQELDTG